MTGTGRLLPRCTTTLGVYEARKSLGWAIFFAGVVIITLSAIAMFLRSIVMTDLVGRTPAELPLWFTELAARGLAAIEGSTPVVTLPSLKFARDGILFAVSGALEFPSIVLYLVLAGVIAAAFAAAITTAFALTAVLAEDVFGGLKLGLQSDAVRVMTAAIRLASTEVNVLASSNSTHENMKQKKAATPMPAAMVGRKILPKNFQKG